MLNPDLDWELRGPADELAGLVLMPRGNREAVRLLARDVSWRVTPAGGRWRFIAVDEATREPAAFFARRRLLHRHEKRLWRSSRSDDPDRFGGVFGDGGGGAGGDGGGGGS